MHLLDVPGLVTRLHSPRTQSSPRSRNCRSPITDLMMPSRSVFHGVRIAKRGAKGTPQARTWISREPGYRVRDEYGEHGALTIVVEYWFARVQ